MLQGVRPGCYFTRSRTIHTNRRSPHLSYKTESGVFRRKSILCLGCEFDPKKLGGRWRGWWGETEVDWPLQSPVQGFQLSWDRAGESWDMWLGMEGQRAELK